MVTELIDLIGGPDTSTDARLVPSVTADMSIEVEMDGVTVAQGQIHQQATLS